VVAIVIESVFHLEMHQDDVFLFFKKLFFILTHQNNPKILKNINFKQKKLKSLKAQVGPRFQMNLNHQ